MSTTTNAPVVTESSTGVRKEVSKGVITLDRIYKNEFQKAGTLTAQIRQVITTKSSYPTKKVSSEAQANIFATEEFGFASQDFFNEETRVAWIPVPETATEAEVKARLEAAVKNGATIYRILSNYPILDSNQKYAINQGLSTLDDFANAQVVRYPDSHALKGQIWTDQEGNVQYRKTYFWSSPMEDKDLRGTSEKYVSPEIKAELEGASVMEGQTI